MGNSVNTGGGIFNEGTLTVSNSSLSNNSANYSYGGGIYNRNAGNGGSLTISNTTLSGNSANTGYGGGGIYNDGGTLTVSNSSLWGNSGSNGGGIYNDYGTQTVSINPANKLIRKRKGLAVAGEATIVKGIGAIACLVRSGIVGSKESSDGHRVTRWTL